MNEPNAPKNKDHIPFNLRPSSKNLTDDLLALLTEPKFSDLSFCVDGKDIEVHSLILRYRCPDFMSCFIDDTDTDTFPQIDVNDFSFDVFYSLILLFYSDRTSVTAENNEEFLQLIETYKVNRVQQITSSSQDMGCDATMNGDFVFESLSLDLERMFIDGQTDGDITFILEHGKKVKSWSLILCARSEYFNALLAGGFSESDKTDVDLRNISKKTLLALLEYYFTDNIKVLDIKLAITVLIKANEFGEETIKQKMEEFLLATIDTSNVAEFLEISKVHHAYCLMSGCLTFLGFELPDLFNVHYKQLG